MPERDEPSPSFLDRYDITPVELTTLIEENGSLRGMLEGYVAEFHLQRLLRAIEGVSDVGKPDDHDRKKKGDRVIKYKGQLFRIESKSLQSTRIVRDASGAPIRAVAQVDASDSREVLLPNGDRLKTTNLLVGQFDILSINLFALHGEWNFVFCRNTDIERTSYTKYTPAQREFLLATSVKLDLPLRQPPFYDDLKTLLDEMVAERLRESVPEPIEE